MTIRTIHVIAPSCDHCENALFGPGGVFCRVFNEDIWNEKVAQDCEQFDPQPWVNGGA